MPDAGITGLASARPPIRIPAAIVGGDVHLGLAFEVQRRAELRQLAVARFRLGAVVRHDSPLAGKPFVTLRDCTDQPLILPKANFANREQLHPLFFHSRLQNRGRFEAGSVELMRQLVLRGLGVAFMTRVGIEAYLDGGELVTAGRAGDAGSASPRPKD